jgi:hypothetical protein
MSQTPEEPQDNPSTLEEQGVTGKVFNNYTFHSNVTVFIDSYGYRYIGDIVRLQELRLNYAQEQASNSSEMPLHHFRPQSQQSQLLKKKPNLVSLLNLGK